LIHHIIIPLRLFPLGEDLTVKIENKLKKKVESISMYKGNLITKEMKGYLIPKGSRPGKVQGNPKMHKKNNPCRVIVNDLVVRPCKAFSHAVLASLRGTLGYRALTSKQNMIAPFGKGC
jgi:hypothetical protein